jgi:hypothetical protein
VKFSLPQERTVDANLENLLRAYPAGEIDQLALQELTGLWCGDILLALAERGLPLPRVDSTLDFNPAQCALCGEIFA